MDISYFVKLPKSPAVFAIFLSLLTFTVGAMVKNIDVLENFIYVEVSAKSQIAKKEQTAINSTFEAFKQTHPPVNPNTTYEELLLTQNSQLEELIEKTDREIHTITQEKTHTIGIVYAPAGYGKTGLITTAIERSSTRPIKKYSVVGHDLKVEHILPKHNSQKAPDLILDGEAINHLPTANRADILEFWTRVLTDTPSNSLLLIDGLDEAHQSAAKILVDTAKEKRSTRELGDRDIIFLTRPEVVDRLIESDPFLNNLAGIEIVGLKPHKISRASLQLRVKNFLDYKALKAIDHNPDLPHDDEVVKGINDRKTVNQVSSKVEELIMTQPYLAELLRIGFLTSLIIDHAEDPLNSSLGRNEADIKENILKRLFNRNQASHDRPTLSGDVIYRTALFEIAARVSPDSNGTFSVPSRIRVEHPTSDGTFTFIPTKVLQRSGLVNLLPARGNELYRFEPVWLQSTLAAHSAHTYTVLSVYRLLGLIAIVFIVAYFAELIYSASNESENKTVTS